MTLMRGKLLAFLCTVGISPHVTRYETITDLMQLQDQIESFQKLVFSHFRASTNNECRISALVPLVKESWGIYRFITSMLRAMYRRSLYYYLPFYMLILPFKRRDQ
jgi:huntingtin-interacting protein 1-related protein